MSMSAGNTVTGKDFCGLSARLFTNVPRGCVTPKQIENLIEVSGGDTDMVDGYDELPAEFQESVKFALENGHIPDADCTHVSIFTQSLRNTQT